MPSHKCENNVVGITVQKVCEKVMNSLEQDLLSNIELAMPIIISVPVPEK
jgi:hypothetical protein